MIESREHLLDVLSAEGVDRYSPDFYERHSQELTSAALELTGTIPREDDYRWGVIREWSSLKAANVLKENAMQAVYASTFPSYRHRYGRMENPESILHHARAIQNIRMVEELRTLFPDTFYLDFPSKDEDLTIAVNYQPTTRGKKGRDNFGITGCPEALHQFQTWAYFGHEQEFTHQLSNGWGYVGRIGFNFHLEDDVVVATLANIQGCDGCENLYGIFKKGASEFFTNLSRSMLTIIAEHVGDIHLRGFIRTHPTVPNLQLYNMVFRALKIPRRHKYMR